MQKLGSRALFSYGGYHVCFPKYIKALRWAWSRICSLSRANLVLDWSKRWQVNLSVKTYARFRNVFVLHFHPFVIIYCRHKMKYSGDQDSSFFFVLIFFYFAHTNNYNNYIYNSLQVTVIVYKKKKRNKKKNNLYVSLYQDSSFTQS